MAGEDKPRPDRRARATRRLKDISHLYLSTGRSAAARVESRRPRSLRLGVISAASDRLARVETCANLAVQWARAGHAVLVVDLDAALPSVGFRLGLEPDAYLAPLETAASSRIEPALLGITVATGFPAVAGAPDPALAAALSRARCVVFHLPSRDPEDTLQRWRQAGPGAPPTPAASTIARAGERSRMFGAWLETAQRERSRQGKPDAGRDTGDRAGGLDAIVDVESAVGAEGEAARAAAFLGVPRLRLLWARVGVGDPPPRAAWGVVEPDRSMWSRRLPLSAWCPEHPLARRYEGMAQALLARVSAGRAAPGPAAGRHSGGPPGPTP